MCHSPLTDLDASEFEFAVKECPSFEKTQLQKDNCNQENLSSQNGRHKNYSTRKSGERFVYTVIRTFIIGYKKSDKKFLVHIYVSENKFIILELQMPFLQGGA
ncbi:hypothetical protein CDAR_298691 [Caerostris darwini]|uniref:Uncharacterized protein n=1 Tax=Caerostris darwini TaxID=1538125 RepID=A0AAV4MVW2_9ARAC|nr:hypothetical protein CDAR_298691 [Caerostris darwini]